MEQKLDITDEFERAFQIANDTNDSMLLMGNAGTGKSTFIKYFTANTKKRFVLLAPTGTAAVNIGGQTIHSFFGFPPKPITPNSINPNVALVGDLYRRIDTIFIDEISCVRADLLDGINYFLQQIMDDYSPFGGKQIIMMGDLSQLPPVVKTDAEKEMFRTNWSSEFFFSANVFKEVEVRKVLFTKTFRQKNMNFINILNKIKYDQISEEEVELLNGVCYNPNVDFSNTTTLCTTNNDARIINQKQLNKIAAPEVILNALITGNFNPESCPVDAEIPVKIGCKVMFRRNDPEHRYYNGTVGILQDISSDNNSITVELKDGARILLQRHKFESVKHQYDSKKNSMKTDVTGAMEQFPICNSYAISIHKSQGATLDKLNLEFGRGAFSSGQTYVAISRCTTLKGITFLRKLKRSDIFVDDRIKFYMDKFAEESWLEQQAYNKLKAETKSMNY